MPATSARLGKLRLDAGRLAYVAPTVPHTPTPPHQSTAGPLSLKWLGDGNNFDVYFGEGFNPPLVGTTSSRAWVLPPLAVGHGYRWRIVAKANPLGPAQSGPEWTFNAWYPAAPVYISPPNHSTNQPTAITLSWSQPQTVPGDITFDVYFGPTPTPALVQRRQTATTYTPAPLKDGIDYFWRIVSVNNIDQTSGPTWTFQTRNPTKGLITIGGVDVRARVRIAGISIRDLLADTPNTATFTIEGTAPTIGKEVRIGLASLAGDDVIFGGYLDTVEALYEGRPENRAWRVTAQDYVYGINRRKVRTRYTQQSATAIALDLLAKYSPAGYTGTHIVAGLPIVTGGIDFTEEDLSTCFARLAQRIGGYWYVDYARDVHLFLTEASSAPTPITRAARVLLNEPAIHWSTDLSQIRTRVFVEGGGSQARALVGVGATSLPVIDASWYSPSGGLVVSGPQRIRYTGKGTVGGPAKPIATGQSVPGALGAGPYSYVVTQVIAGAESPLSAASTPVSLPPVAGPTTPLSVAAVSFSGVPAPVTPPTVTPALSGVAPPATSPGVAWVSTIVAPPASAMSAAGALPMTGLITATPSVLYSNHVDLGSGTMHPTATGFSYQWKATYTNARGEGSANQSTDTYGNLNNSFNMRLDYSSAPAGQGITSIKIYRAGNGNTTYRLTGTLGPGGGTFIDTKPDSAIANAQILPTSNTTGTPGGGGLTPGGYNYRTVFVTSNGATNAGPANGITLANGSPFYSAAQLSGVPTSGDGRVTSRRIYRTTVNGGTYYLLATISDNATATYLDTKPDSQLGAALSDVNTSGTGGLVAGQVHLWMATFVTGNGETTRGPDDQIWHPVPAGYDQAQISSIPIGPAQVVARRLYRNIWTGSAWSEFQLVATINDNVTTTYLDTKTNAQLGATSPANNTTGGGGLVPGVAYAWLLTFVTTAGETTNGPWTGWITMPANCDVAQLLALECSTDARVTKRKIYRVGPAGVWQLETTINDNVTTTYTSTKTDGALGATGLPPANTTGSGGLSPGGYWWLYQYLTASGGYTTNSGGTNYAVPAGIDTVQLTGIAVSPDARVTKRRIYRTTVNGGIYKLEAEIADNTTTTYTSTKADSALGADFIPGNTTSAGGQIAVSSIAIGGGTTTARKLYRTESGGSAYKLVTTIADNTTATYQDNKSDAALGALAPLDEVTELIGIPASGEGSIRSEIRMGDDVNIFVECNDTAAQSALAALEGSPSQGIVEHVLQDRRLGLAEATATGNADLALFARPLVTINYATRDPKTRSGKTVQINLPELSLVGDFTIQTVEIDEIDKHPGLHPQYRVTCSSVRFSFEDAVRRFRLDDTGASA